ncbi:recombinase family protein [Actinomycetospora lutea]|uniref:recombinase family protein n=1 Tax=Actinomycetospora lutea TaxID=663604 RepID=UPI003B67F07E
MPSPAATLCPRSCPLDAAWPAHAPSPSSATPRASARRSKFVANTIANSAQYERRLIGQRTREGLAAKRAQGVRLGRPSRLPSEVVERIVRDRGAGEPPSPPSRRL